MNPAEIGNEILEGFFDCTWTLDKEGKLLSVSEKFWSHLGNSSLQETIAIEDFKEHVFDEDLSAHELLLNPEANYAGTKGVAFLHRIGDFSYSFTRVVVISFSC